MSRATAGFSCVGRHTGPDVSGRKAISNSCLLPSAGCSTQHPPVEQLQQVHIVGQAHRSLEPRQRPRQVQPHVGNRIPGQRQDSLQQMGLWKEASKAAGTLSGVRSAQAVWVREPMVGVRFAGDGRAGRSCLPPQTNPASQFAQPP